MAQYRQINTRSPFYVQLATAQPLVELELRIWYGDVTSDKPTDATYTLEKEAVGGEATFEISELIRDYCSQTSDATSGKVWVQTALNDFNLAASFVTYLATEGYTLYTEGLQHNGNTWQTDYALLPVDEDGNYRVTTSENSNATFDVLVNAEVSGTYQKTVYLNSGINSISVYPISTTSTGLIRTETIGPNTNRVEFSLGGEEFTVYNDVFDCNKYNNSDILAQTNVNGQAKPVKLYYVNKFGGKNTFHFTLKHTESVNSSSDSFNRNTANLGNLNAANSLHATRKRITGSKQSFVINTDFIPEYYVSQLEELVLSEYVWAQIPHISNNYIPVNLKDSRIDKKNHLNDRLIQYTMNIETASEYINNVR